ncbi:MAG: DUF7557 family protein [Nanoarchaeota archaeon]
MNTTIAISKNVRDQIKEFGNKGETYDEIIARIIKSAKERQIQNLLMDTTNSIPITKALKKAKQKWQ